MKHLYTFFLTLIFFTASLLPSAQTWHGTNALDASGAYYITSSAHLGDVVYANGAGPTAFNNFVFSEDLGLTWSAPLSPFPEDQIATLTAIHGRLYAAVRNVSLAYSYEYTTDNGISWTSDNEGMPDHWSGTGKAAFNLKAMNNDQMAAYDATQLFVKTTSSTLWVSRNIDFVLVDLCVQGDTWFATSASAIYKSNDNGITWSLNGNSGLPSDFQGNIIASNGEDRLFVSAAPAQGGSDIYFSNDGGNSWSLTNSSEIYTHANAWVAEIYAVNDYVFASINPDGTNFNDTPKYIASSLESPNFSAGDADGFPEGYVVAPIPIYFHIEEQLFAMYQDVFTTTPGFDGAVNVSSFDRESFNVYPNPCKDVLFLGGESNTSYRILSANGVEVLSGRSNGVLNTASLSSGMYFLVCQEKTIRFVKN